jgi:hypothetical protein
MLLPAQVSQRRRLTGENVKAKKRAFSKHAVLTFIAMISSASIVVAFSVTLPKRTVTTGTRLYDYFEDSRMDGPPSLLNTTSTVAKSNRKSAKKQQIRINGNSRIDYPENAPKAKVLPGTLGDIMSRGDDVLGDSSSSSQGGTAASAAAAAEPVGLVTTAMISGTTLANRFGIEHPLDRMALTANGNLQRLVSSYYDAPVQVVVDFCEPVIGVQQRSMATPNTMQQYSKPQVKTWERIVHLTVHNKVSVPRSSGLGSLVGPYPVWK